MKADDCRPNKALRTTIKVFLRKKGIEREAALKKESLGKNADSPVEPPPSQGVETSVSGDGESNGVAAEVSSGILNKPGPKSNPSTDAPQTFHLEDQVDVPMPSIEVCDLTVWLRRLLTAFSLPMTEVTEMSLTISRQL